MRNRCRVKDSAQSCTDSRNLMQGILIPLRASSHTPGTPTLGFGLRTVSSTV